MTLTSIAARNIGRNKLRTSLTIAVVAISTLFFIMLRIRKHYERVLGGLVAGLEPR